MYKPILPNDDGWTDFVTPVKGYKFACCDCKLVHDMDFKIVFIERKNKDGTYEVSDVVSETLKVVFRAKRNNRATGQLRRKK